MQYVEIITDAVTGEETIRPYTPEEIAAAQAAEAAAVEVARASLSLSFAQLLIGLVTEQWITVEEGRQWRDRVSLPAQVQWVIQSLPPEQQFAAETRALAPSEILRNDQLVIEMGKAAGKTAEEMDEFFRTYAQV